MGLLRVTSDTGQVGKLTPADLAPAREIQQAPPATTATSGDNGVTGTQGSASIDEPSEAWTGTTAGHDDGQAHERFEGRGDDD